MLTAVQNLSSSVHTRRIEPWKTSKRSTNSRPGQNSRCRDNNNRRCQTCQFLPCVCEYPLMNHLGLLFFKSVHSYWSMKLSRRVSIFSYQHACFSEDAACTVQSICYWSATEIEGFDPFYVGLAFDQFLSLQAMHDSVEHKNVSPWKHNLSSTWESRFWWTKRNYASKQRRQRAPIILPDLCSPLAGNRGHLGGVIQTPTPANVPPSARKRWPGEPDSKRRGRVFAIPAGRTAAATAVRRTKGWKSPSGPGFHL